MSVPADTGQSPAGNDRGPLSHRLMCLYCCGAANRVVITPYLPQAEMGGGKENPA